MDDLKMLPLLSGSTIAGAIDNEVARQANGLELIASENFVSEAVLEAMGSGSPTNMRRLPRKRYYGGCEWSDVVEQAAIDRAKELFGAEHANVQPHSGAQANMSVYLAAIQYGDQILGMNLSHGGHLTHGHPMNFSGISYKVADYGVSRETEQIDYDELQASPKNINRTDCLRASAYSRIIDFKRIGEIAKALGPACCRYRTHRRASCRRPASVASAHADYVTQQLINLRGPRGGLILCKEEHAKEIDENFSRASRVVRLFTSSPRRLSLLARHCVMNSKSISARCWQTRKP